VAEGPPEKIINNKNSHTGRILAELLHREPREKRKAYDPTKAEPADEVFFDEEQELGDARMPWEIDGRNWHTRDRVGRRGEKVRWQGEALEWLIDEIEAAGKGKFAPTNYNSRSTVEIKMPGNDTPWFFHARTGGTWLLDVSFRVPNRAFSAAEVRRLLPLKPLDDCDDLPIYGRRQRVKVHHAGRSYDDIRMQIHSKDEIATDGGREFIKRAVKAYQRLVRNLAEDVALRQPWKVNGRSWHLSQQMIKKSETKQWKGTLIIELLGKIKKIAPRVKEDWARKVMVVLHHPDIDGNWARFITNHGQGLRVEIRTRRGQFTPAMIENIGLVPEIKQQTKDDRVIFWLQRIEQLDNEQFTRLVRESIEPLTQDNKTLFDGDDNQ